MANKYKAGDIVRVCDAETMVDLIRQPEEYDVTPMMLEYCGKSFKVNSVSKDFCFLEGVSWRFHEALLELVSEVSEVSKPKFEIGDNVQICSKDDMLKGSPLAGVTSTMLNYGHHVGKIIDISDSGAYFKVTGTDGWWFHESLLDKLEVGYNLGDVNDDFEEEERTYKIGDMVQICGKLWMEYLEKDEHYNPNICDYDIVEEMYAYCGKVGKVTQVYDYDDSYRIEGCGDWWFHSDMLLPCHTPQDLDGEIMDLGLVEEEKEDEFEDWISKPDLKVKPGDKVRIKTHEELIETGWTFYGDNYFHSIDGEAIVSGMHKFLGEVHTVEKIVEGDIKLEEDYEYWNWTSYMIAEVVEENTYRDEEGNPFDPNADYIEEEEYQPYCAVVDKIKNNPSEWATYKPTETNWEDEYKPTTWDKDRIQRGFENLEMYNKGYADGFQRALELMKKEFGVE